MADNFARLKFRWLDRLMHDTTLSATERLVGYEIGCHLNSKSGDAWPSQARIAARLGIDLKSVKRATAALSGAPKKKYGPPRTAYVVVDFDPITRRNTYVPCFDALPNATPQGGGDMPPSGGVVTPSDGDIYPAGGDITPRFDGGKNGPITNLRELIYEKDPAPTACAGTRNDARWQSIKNRLAISLSPGLVKSWFDPMQLVAITDAEIVLRSPSEFALRHVENDRLFDRLSDAARAELSAQVRVRLVPPPMARAAE